jgi:hypothetical protein
VSCGLFSPVGVPAVGLGLPSLVIVNSRLLKRMPLSGADMEHVEAIEINWRKRDIPLPGAPPASKIKVTQFISMA